MVSQPISHKLDTSHITGKRGHFDLVLFPFPGVLGIAPDPPIIHKDPESDDVPLRQLGAVANACGETQPEMD